MVAKLLILLVDDILDEMLAEFENTINPSYASLPSSSESITLPGTCMVFRVIMS